ncbi:N-acetyltransferase [Rhodococcus sp. IEGM 1381]|uniref:GNAT family N-acetyltransferase n=1 Tax=Rhodococcus sp. IEGM 1381 TaxID=3047085 RepID=UPI0024B74CD2|nr:N-acetyltransferase [Rhodococcus sp. IEGM 1381]MDI9897282.1 N-acetyltransferase [Rhodococcus sp. IEGM 1381]
MTVRVATIDDAPGLAELAAVTFPLACPSGTRPEDIESFISNTLSVKHFQTYVADASKVVLVDDGAVRELLGYAMLVVGDPSDPHIRASLTHLPTLEVSKLYVRPTGHGTGVAGRLMTAALDHASEIGCAGSWLGVNQENERAQKFYRKHGFRIAGTKTFVVGGRTEDDYVMETELPVG